MRSLSDAAPGEVALYVHWPYCARICPYCDFNVVRDRGRRDEQSGLARAILADVTAQAEAMGRRRLVSIFFGGGTPSLMDPDWAGEIIAAARARFDAAPDLEVTLEANPTDAEAHRAADVAGRTFLRLSLDLIYALPGQTVAAWRADLAAALALGPEHISAYQLTLEPGTPFDRAVERGRWAPPE